MRITPDDGRRIFGVLLILAGLAGAIGPIFLSFDAKSRTSTTAARILSSYETGMGIGPLRHQSVKVRYEFFANGTRFENEQLVDYVPPGQITVNYDPISPANNSLALPNGAPEFLGVLAALMIFVGLGLLLRIWAPLTQRS